MRTKIPVVTCFIALFTLLAMVRGAAQSWQSIGPDNGLVSGGEVGFRPSIALDTGGMPYIAYGTRTDYVAVKKYSGSAWVDVGSPMHFPDSVPRVYYSDIAIDKHNNVYVAFLPQFDSAGTTYPYSNPRVIKWNGSSWSMVGTPVSFDPNTSASGIRDISLVIDKNDTVYVAFSGYTAYSPDISGTAATVLKFDGTNWVHKGDSPYLKGNSQLQLTIDTANTIYLASTDHSTASRVYIHKWDDTGWLQIADEAIADVTWAGYVCTAINKVTNEYYAFYNGCLMAYNGISWHQHSCTYIFIISQPNLKVNNSGAPIIAFETAATMGSDNRWAKQYNGASWEPVGGPTPDPFFGDDLKMAVGKNDDLFITYYYSTSSPQGWDAFAMYYGPPLSVSEVHKKDRITVYPNPIAGNRLTIDAQSLRAGRYHAKLRNLLGQLVYESTYTHHGGATAILDFDKALPAGMYYLMLSNATDRYSATLMAE